MQRGQLSDYFEGVGVKRLSAVDAEPKTSNQHEVGTTKKRFCRKFFVRLRCSILWTQLSSERSKLRKC